MKLILFIIVLLIIFITISNYIIALLLLSVSHNIMISYIMIKTGTVLYISDDHEMSIINQYKTNLQPIPSH